VENKPKTGQEEARLYIGHGEYIACHNMALIPFSFCITTKVPKSKVFDHSNIKWVQNVL